MIDVLEARIAKLEVDMAELKTKAGAQTAWPSRGGIANDSELDSQYGDPSVHKDPRRWNGPSYAGRKMSECPPEYLDELCGLYDWMADKDDEKGAKWTSKDGTKTRPASEFKRKDAARARGWAKRLRDGWTPNAKSTPSPYGNSGYVANAKHTGTPDADPFDTGDADDSIPF